ncbi:MAG: deoxyribonuclease [SAR324 cluster bacterium]|uniref:Deoxyribonuclease n=1 Tax=SAR324 cluster bacterium TaxID=2024889 RepID=A0A2A4T9Y6_9DELT|nr:MAG: deoxyribonuclease [SAR324 cluster bacterium]
MKKVILLLSIVTSIFAEHPKSFSAAKKAMYTLWEENPKTFYCDCTYDRKNKGNMIDRKSCGYTPRNEFTKKGKINKRARRTEAEHVLPAENFYRQLSCSRDPKRPKKISKRNWCYKTDNLFRRFHDDVQNLVPSVGELNADRSNRRYGALEPKSNQYGECKFEVDFKANKAYVKPNIKGDIARIYFYLEETYGVKISKNEKRILEVWTKTDPVDAWERKRTDIIMSKYH